MAAPPQLSPSIVLLGKASGDVWQLLAAANNKQIVIVSCDLNLFKDILIIFGVCHSPVQLVSSALSQSCIKH